VRRLTIGEEKRKKKERRKKEDTTGQKYNGLPYSIRQTVIFLSCGAILITREPLNGFAPNHAEGVLGPSLGIFRPFTAACMRIYAW